jgi:hypothetical protein
MAGGYIGVDLPGVESWQGQLEGAHEAVINALNHYRTIAEQNNDVAKGSHFVQLNEQCDNITNKHLSEHTELHTQYKKASSDLVQGVIHVAGN